MPIISRFFGIIIYIYWRDHQPPHFHARHGDDEVIIEIETGEVTGHISRRAVEMLQKWRKLHINELLDDWKRAEQKKALRQIAPLE